MSSNYDAIHILDVVQISLSSNFSRSSKIINFNQKKILKYILYITICVSDVLTFVMYIHHAISEKLLCNAFIVKEIYPRNERYYYIIT